MTTSITIRVDDDKVVAALRNVANGIDDVIERVAEELAETVADEARPASSRLGAPWQVGAEGDTRHVIAPEWWAHFIAGGTADHGPSTAPRLAFSVDGTMVYARHVRGISADPFDKRAVARTESRVDDIMRDVIARAT